MGWKMTGFKCHFPKKKLDSLQSLSMIQTRKMQVKYEGEEDIDQNWISTKYVERVNEEGTPIPKPSRASRSSSRGRDASDSKSKKKGVSSRTRSKSRERQPTAAFSADEDAEPTTVQA